MSHLKHPGTHWGKQLFDAGQPAYFGRVRREERRQARHVYNQFYRDIAKHHGDHVLDEDGEVCYGVELVDEPAPPQREWKEQSDYLVPLKRFLMANVNRPWAEVHSKLARRTNRNSTCGDHLWLHLNGYIEKDPWRIERELNREYSNSTFYWHDYYVDENGIFRRLGKDPVPQNKPKKGKSQITEKQAKAWVGVTTVRAGNSISGFYTREVYPKKVLVIGNKLFWCEAPSYHQGRELTDEEAKFYNRCDERAAKAITYETAKEARLRNQKMQREISARNKKLWPTSTGRKEASWEEIKMLYLPKAA